MKFSLSAYVLLRTSNTEKVEKLTNRILKQTTAPQSSGSGLPTAMCDTLLQFLMGWWPPAIKLFPLLLHSCHFAFCYYESQCKCFWRERFARGVEPPRLRNIDLEFYWPLIKSRLTKEKEKNVRGRAVSDPPALLEWSVWVVLGGDCFNQAREGLELGVHFQHPLGPLRWPNLFCYSFPNSFSCSSDSGLLGFRGSNLASVCREARFSGEHSTQWSVFKICDYWGPATCSGCSKPVTLEWKLFSLPAVRQGAAQGHCRSSRPCSFIFANTEVSSFTLVGLLPGSVTFGDQVELAENALGNLELSRGPPQSPSCSCSLTDSPFPSASWNWGFLWKLHIFE